MPRKRSNGEGSLHKRSNGLWEWQIMVGYQPDGKRKMKSFYGRTQKEVKEKAAKYLEDLRAAPEISKEMAFTDWADIWYESMKGQVAEQTYESYQYTLNILKEYFRDDRLIDIRAIDIENFLKKMTDEGRSHSYITKFRGMLFQIMKKAEANDLIRKNPVAYADKQKNTDAKSEKDAFTIAEIRHLMKVLPYDRMGMSIRLMLGTGMRTQEIMALEPKHIEEDGSCIHIRQAVTMVKGSPRIGPPKTKTSYRDIPVPSHLREIAKEFRNTSEQYIWHGEEVPICNPSVFRKHFRKATEQYIWHGETVPICNPSVFRKHFKKALIAAGKVRLLSPHCCRHTYVSQLQAQGVPLETIQSLTGHADVDMTEHYQHVQKEVKENAAKKLDSLFKKGKPTLHIA